MRETDDDRGSRLPPTLLAAYRATWYEVNGASPPFVLRVDEPSAALAACHRAHGVHCSAFLTAWNPGSRPAAAAENHAAAEDLERRLASAGYRTLAGRGVDPDDRWPPEDSRLVLGVDRRTAVAIAREFRQAGLLYSGADAVPRLVLLE